MRTTTTSTSNFALFAKRPRNWAVALLSLLACTQLASAMEVGDDPVYLVRHGESMANKFRVVEDPCWKEKYERTHKRKVTDAEMRALRYPLTDAPLTGERDTLHSGMNMAHRAGVLFREWVEEDPHREFPKVIVTSPLLRAMQSADQFMKGAGMTAVSEVTAPGQVKVVLDPRVREVSKGAEDMGTPPSRWNADAVAADSRAKAQKWETFRGKYNEFTDTRCFDDREWNVATWETFKDLDWLMHATWPAREQAYWETYANPTPAALRRAPERPSPSEAVADIRREQARTGPVMIFTHSGFIDKVTSKVIYMDADRKVAKTATALNKGAVWNDPRFEDKYGYNHASAVLQLQHDGSAKAVWDPRDLGKEKKDEKEKPLEFVSEETKMLWGKAFPRECGFSPCQPLERPAGVAYMPSAAVAPAAAPAGPAAAAAVAGHATPMRGAVVRAPSAEVARAASSPTRTPCKYGTDCHQKSNQHFARFSHPDEIDDPIARMREFQARGVVHPPYLI